MESQGFEEYGSGPQDLFPELTSPIHPLAEVEGVEESERLRRPQANPALVAKLNEAEFTIFERLDYLWRTHTYISGNFRLADAKAAVTIVFGSSIIGSLYAARLHEPCLDGPMDQWSPATWLAASAFVALGTSILLSALSVQPRLWNTEGPDHIYWENILSHKSVEAYWSQFHKETAEDLEHGLCTNIYAIASVCQRKYRCLRISVWLALLGGGLGATLLIARH
jgi:hypothetical protein